MNFHPDKQLFQVAGAGIEPLTLGSQGQCSTPTPRGLTGKLCYCGLPLAMPRDSLVSPSHYSMDLTFAK